MMKFMAPFFLILSISIISSFSTAIANCGSCSANQCSSDQSAWKAIDEKREELRKEMVPERIIQLLTRTGSFCASCIQAIGTPRIKVIQNNGAEGVGPWNPPRERAARAAMKAGNIKAFYIFLNNGKKCSCCNQKPYDELTDYDDDLDINRNGPVFIFERATQVGTDQTRGHYARLKKSLPPVLNQPDPKAPRIIHTTCKHCTQKEEALNVINRDIFALQTEIHSLNKGVDVDQRIVIGWHNNLVDIYNDSSLDESSFNQKKQDAEDRLKIFEDSLADKLKILAQKTAALNAKTTEKAKREKEFKDCGDQVICTSKKPIFEDPRPLEDIACNTITDNEVLTEDFTAHRDDLFDLETYLSTTISKWNSCQNDFDCVVMDCKKTEPTLATHSHLLENIKAQKDWALKYKQAADKYYLDLSSLTIQSQTNLNDLEWTQALQAYMHNLGSVIINVVDLARVAKSLANNPSGNAAQDAVTRASTLDKLLKADQAFETVVTTTGLVNTLTSHIQFPFVEGEGIPYVRVLNNYSLSLGLCFKSLLSELVDSLDHVQGNRPYWRDNVLALIAKTGLCVSTYQMMERQKLIDGIKKDLIAEEKVRRFAYARKLCVGRRYDHILQLIPDLDSATKNAKQCIQGPCDTPNIPAVKTGLSSYGEALKHFESVLQADNSRLYAAKNDLIFNEAPAAEMKLALKEFLPGERMTVEYSIPWCKANSSFIAILDKTEPSGNRSTSDILYEHQMFRGQAKGKINLVTPSIEGDFHLRIYDNATDGKEYKRTAFKVSETLGNLIDTGEFTEVYLGEMPDQTNGFADDPDHIVPGMGVLNIAARDAAGKRRSTYIYVYPAGNHSTQIYAGWNPVMTLPVGIYDIKLNDYLPARWLRGVQVLNQKISYFNYGGDGRLLLFPKDALGDPQPGYITITSPDSDFKTGTWGRSIDLPPGRYHVSFDTYVPKVIQEFVEIEAGKRTSIKVSGYGRVKLDKKDALGEPSNSFVTIKEHQSQNKIWGGWSRIIDLPPGAYDISFDNYTPPIVVQNFQVTPGIPRTAAAGGYGRLEMIIKDGLGNIKHSHLAIYPKGSQNKVVSSWAHTHDLPPGLYNVDIEGFYPPLSAGDLEVTRGKVKKYLFDGYGRLTVTTTQGNPYRTIYYAGTETKVVGGWQSEYDLKPGLYDIKVNINNQELWSKGQRVSSQSQTTVRFP